MVRRAACTCVLFVMSWFAFGAYAAAILPGFNANTLPPNDDGSSASVALGFEVNLFGTRYSNVFVNNNGNITFDTPQSAYTPFNLQTTDRLIIAPFFADVDTRAAGNPVTYGPGVVDGRPAFGVNWVNVDYYRSDAAHTNRNSFQLVVVSRADRAAGDFDIIFNYDQIQWEAGTASGSDANGRGGFTARAGYAIGRGAPGSSLELPGSAVAGAFLDGGPNSLVRSSRNSNVTGRYIFEIRGQASVQISTLTPMANAPSQSARSDASGRFVVFQSRASNLTSGDSNNSVDIFLIDTRLGTTTLISRDNANNPLSGDSMEPSVSGDGNLVVFVAPDRGVPAVLGESPSEKSARLKQDGWAVFMRNLLTNTTQRVGGGTNGGNGTAPQIAPGVSAIVHTAINNDPNLGAVGQNNVFLTPLTRSGNAVTLGTPRCVSCKSIASNGSDSSTNANGPSANPSVSSDGTWVAWETSAKNSLASTSPLCSGAASYVMLRNMLTGVGQMLSNPASSAQCGASGAGSTAPAISANGRTVVFASTQPLTTGDNNGVSDVFSIANNGSNLKRASQRADGSDGNGASTQPAVSGDGKMVAFVSAATNLDSSASDSNGQADLHVRAVDSNALARLDLGENGQQANAAVNRPALDFDGSLIVFDSSASNLASNTMAGQLNVFQRANPLVQPSLRSATWWRDSESGWGLLVFDQGNVAAAAWFTYDTDGEPFWLLAPVTPNAQGAYTGSLLRFTGAPFNMAAGNVADGSQSQGTTTLTFNADDTLTFAYTYNGTAQTKRLTKFPYGAASVVCRVSPSASRASATNYSDVWWGGAANSGWGLFITHLDNSLFAVWYTYDTDREPVFYIVGATRQADGSFSGRVTRQQNGTPLLSINGSRASPGSTDVGSATLRFSNGETGTFSFTIGATSDSRAISRYQFGNTASLCETSTPSP